MGVFLVLDVVSVLAIPLLKLSIYRYHYRYKDSCQEDKLPELLIDLTNIRYRDTKEIMRYKKCPKCKGTMIKTNETYCCSQCNYVAKTQQDIDRLENYQNTPLKR